MWNWSKMVGAAFPQCRRENQTARAAAKIDCEFPAPDSWQVEGKRRSVRHVGCGARLVRDATRLDTDLLRETRLCCHSRHTI
jgi:hypothetical protein